MYIPGLTKPLQAADLPSRLLLDSVVCLLRSVVVGLAVHCPSLSSRHTRSVSSLLHHLLKFGTGTGTILPSYLSTTMCRSLSLSISLFSVSLSFFLFPFFSFHSLSLPLFFPLSDEQNHSKVASLQHDSWVTLGFLRGVASPPHSSAVFCTPQWIQLLLGLIEDTLPSISRQKQPRYPLEQQVGLPVYVMFVFHACVCTCEYRVYRGCVCAGAHSASPESHPPCLGGREGGAPAGAAGRPSLPPSWSSSRPLQLSLRPTLQDW